MTLKQIELLQPDNKGVITVNLEGQTRRFVKEKLVSFLIDNGAISSAPKKLKAPRTPKNRTNSHKMKPVIAIYPDGKEIEFPSGASAANALQCHKSNISLVLTGRNNHVCGVKFRRVKSN